MIELLFKLKTFYIVLMIYTIISTSPMYEELTLVSANKRKN